MYDIDKWMTIGKHIVFVCLKRSASCDTLHMNLCTPYGVYSEQVAVSTWVAGCSIGRIYIHTYGVVHTYMHSPYNNNTYI